ncbi:alpha/beta hydrolase [Aquitalea sp. FJL05]|uniref:alpha/beta hydrolase n=1 Tax=Aquitalea sp. FJL05 TaxID=2153366 RepID=UPI000F5A7402|nr:alpha/beta fold hydrolase [Aquitalea sp. FJL05]RQO68156.1 alpha/beta hydrolase [Aquitalea sp. FJL05]
MLRRLRLLLLPLLGLIATTALANPLGPTVGVVLMHGKGGSPEKHVDKLAKALQQQGVLLANLDMPWSGRREYDADVASAVKQVQEALESLRNQGARKLVVAGHSQGGLFALYLAGRLPLDGVMAIAPGGNVAAGTPRERLADTVASARSLLAAGHGGEKTRLADFEGSKGLYPITTTPRIYLDWFDPDGAMNQSKAVQQLPASLPVLYISPEDDYPALQRVRQSMFDALPANPASQLLIPPGSHLQAPTAAIPGILTWLGRMAGTD